MSETAWQADVLTLFPEMFPGPLGCSLAGQALERGLWRCAAHDLRAHGLGRHRAVDDTPFGGGAGMVMRPDVVAAALDAVTVSGRPVIYPTPRGRPFRQADARRLAAGAGVVLLCGRFEGVDERVLERRGIEQLSMGDAVLSGGEIPGLLLLDACVRLLPGVMGSSLSDAEESFGTEGCSNTRTTPGRPSGTAWTFPRFSCPAIMRRSPHGDASRRSRSRSHAVPISGAPSRRCRARRRNRFTE